MNIKKLEDKFHSALISTVEIANSHGYYPAYFMKMLSQFGGLATAKHLLASNKAQEGLFRLYELKLLRFSMEATVLREEFQYLFTNDELEIARQRLVDLGYSIDDLSCQ